MLSVSRLVRGAAFALIIQVTGAGLTYVTQVAYARWMGIPAYGVYVYAIAWTTVIALLVGLGFPLSVLRFIPQYRTLGARDLLRGLVRMTRGLTIATGAVVALVGMVIVLAFVRGSSPGASEVAVIALWLIPVGALITLDSSIIRAGGRIIWAYAPSLVMRPLAILLVSAIVWQAHGHLATVAAMIITLGAYILIALLQSKLVYKIPRDKDESRVAMYESRVWLRVSMPLLLVAGFQIALSQADLLIVGATRGLRDAALYQAASKTATLVGYLLVALTAVTAPMFSEYETKRDWAGLQRLATLSALWVFLPTLGLAIGLAALAPVVLGLFGSGFLTARGALDILLFGQVISAGCGAVGYLLGMTGHQDDLARVYGVTAVFNLAACYVGARAFGLIGAASSTTISLIAWNLWLHQLTKRRIGVRASILSSLFLWRQSTAVDKQK